MTSTWLATLQADIPTWPKTARGKAAVSANALCHGAMSTRPVVPGLESTEEWESHRRGVFAYCQPDGHVQETYCSRIALTLWRLNRLEQPHHVSRRGDGAIDVLLGVIERDEGGFELGGGEVEAALQHEVEESGVARGVGALGGGVVGHRLRGEEAGEHRAGAVAHVGNAGGAGSVGQAVGEPRAEALERLVRAGTPQQLERGDAGGHGERVS